MEELIDNGVFVLRNYGKVTINIKSIMKKKNITRNKLSVLTGATYNVINRYYNSDISRVDLDVLARICYVLECNVPDILEYEK